MVLHALVSYNLGIFNKKVYWTGKKKRKEKEKNDLKKMIYHAFVTT